MELVEQTNSPNSFFTQRWFFWLVIILIGLQLLLLGYWFLSQRNLFQKLPGLAAKTDPTTKKQSLLANPTLWSASFQFDTTLNQATLVEPPKLSQADFALPTINQKPEAPEGAWAFEVVVESKKGEVLYRSYRVMTIFPSETNPKIWDFGVIVPYTKDSIIRLFDLNDRQIFIKEI